ncbi:MAG: hypothetical protein ACKODX_16190 [Gemmata sp.]
MSRASLAALALAVLAMPANAGAPAPPPSAFQKFAGAETVVTGRVAAVETDAVYATAPYPGATDKVAYRVAVVKVDGRIVGAGGPTHVKVGFVPPNPNEPPPRGSGGIIRPREPVPVLKDGQEALLFLVKHPTADFYVMPPRFLPVDVSGDVGKKELETVKRFADVLADPMKGLKSGTAEVRAETAALLVAKYRTHPQTGGKVEESAVPVDESGLILKGLAEGDWTARIDPRPNALTAFYHLSLTAKDGWAEPAFPKPGPGGAVDFSAVQKAAFVKWLDGPGKNFRIKKYVPKK